MKTELKDRLRELRRERGYSQQDIARELNISRQAISKWENGKSYPDLDNLFLLSTFYNVPLDHFFCSDIRQNKVKSKKKYIILFIGIIAGYFMSPFGVIILLILFFYTKKADNYRLLIYIFLFIALLRNFNDLYDLWIFNSPQNRIYELEEIVEE
ncbi:helix-turn-helix domain-containing protein [Lysinibacillus varians]|uniref:Helix-turn-helix transcriptional regulator n=1 Tax=Lysinibacillus varians TaxID=1145276 RepID=A0ABY2T6Y8_9BACI|nr:helix-turn-helix transcriptional regulator [Lysinibacillus varians]AHN21533.1 DNA-binding protein [Lysinibacillus varians]TKI59886.1 helix-turn-helix transcriptional regulator [Lysinibacillus varians]